MLDKTVKMIRIILFVLPMQKAFNIITNGQFFSMPNLLVLMENPAGSSMVDTKLESFFSTTNFYLNNER